MHGILKEFTGQAFQQDEGRSPRPTTELRGSLFAERHLASRLIYRGLFVHTTQEAESYQRLMSSPWFRLGHNFRHTAVFISTDFATGSVRLPLGPCHPRWYDLSLPDQGS